MMVSTRRRGLLYHICLLRFSQGLFAKTWHAVPRFLHIDKFSSLKELEQKHPLWPYAYWKSYKGQTERKRT